MWSGSTRRKRLPPEWQQLRLETLRRDSFRCQIRSEGCRGMATDVDHILRGDDHSPNNLRAACSYCHSKKSSAEGNEALRLKRARRKRPEERHPGLR